MPRYPNNEKTHNLYLDELVHRLDEIDEDKQSAVWMMKDGIYLHKDSYAQKKLCDLIIGYRDYGVPVELKGSWNKASYARQQVQSGASFLRHELGMFVPYGKVVVYDKGFYEFKVVDL